MVLRMSATPSVLSCLQRMEVAMKQPVRPMPALRAERRERLKEESAGPSVHSAAGRRLYLQWTTVGPAEGGASSRALSTCCTSSRRGGALSGVF